MPAGSLGMVDGRKHGGKFGVDAAVAHRTLAKMTHGWAGGWGWE